MTFKHYPEARLRVSSIYSRLTPEENAFREKMLARIVNHARPYSPDDLLDGFSADQSRRMTEELTAKGAVVTDDNGQVIFAYPVSALRTPHRVTLADERIFHAMCAIDAIGAAFTFRQDVRIDASCAECGMPVQIGIKGGRLDQASPPNIHVLHVDLQKENNWAGSC
jgi:hypothetical protein